jgi:hypothetical protein
MKQDYLTVRDIYIGKPDARDEFSSADDIQFLSTFVIPPNFDINGLVNGDQCFIRGYKGTGKTALLLYLDSIIRKKDDLTCTTFVLFKSDYGNTKKQELEVLSKRLIKSIDIDKSDFENEQDFEYIWRWIIFRRIVDDNLENNNGIFVNNEQWDKFEKIINSILCKSQTSFFKIPKQLKLALAMTPDATTVKPELTLDFDKTDNLKEYTYFNSLIDKATKAFAQLQRTDIPYYIFIDELEAFYADNKIFQRDLRMIRDLIITVKFFNNLFSNFKNTKIVCSIRSEIINSICNFVPTKEINKILTGYECPLKWDYNNTNSYAHPIIEIWLKRIALSEREYSNREFRNNKEIFDKWFCKKVDGIDTINYVLNNTWNKPRDIVRFLNATKDTLNSNSRMYTQAIFDASVGQYSKESLDEIKEELNALYKPNEMAKIIECLTGYKPIFSFEELNNRVEKYFNDTILAQKLTDILSNLYRVGILGNYSVTSNVHRWQHKGNEGIILNEDWKIVVHRALTKVLSLNIKNERHKISKYKDESPLTYNALEQLLSKIK